MGQWHQRLHDQTGNKLGGGGGEEEGKMFLKEAPKRHILPTDRHSFHDSGSYFCDWAEILVGTCFPAANGLYPPLACLLAEACDVKSWAGGNFRQLHGAYLPSHLEAGNRRKDGLHLEW